ncbi:MAG: sulfite exporter TauE/SafE family protein [Thiothrix sp.]|nr:MAG: sulfite exporter TauE/SafE family protein [Thiothrix sp.]
MLILYITTGAIAGVLAGLLGVGGGIIIVPALLWSFNRLDIATDHAMQAAVGTSLATIVITSLSSILAHQKRGAILWKTVRDFTPGILLGAIFGAIVADYIPSHALQTVFAIFILLVAVQMILGGAPSPHRQLPGKTIMKIAGSTIGLLSAVVGIGGGSLTVPFLAYCNITMQKAVATSSACGLPIAIAGSIGFAITGLNESNLPEWSSGYIYWPAFAGITVMSALFAPLGTRLAHALPVVALKQVFGLLLLLMGLKILTG